jgi:replication factor C small subunit
MSVDLWITKYRPQTLDEFVWRDPAMREKVEEWLKDRALPHLLFSGASGTGKTSLAYLLLKLLGIPNDDILFIPASRERGIDALQTKILGFIGAWAFNDTGLKYILFDEADKLSATAQGMLRTESETYAETCRFIMTCNYPNKIIVPLHSRLQEIKFTVLDRDSFILRAADVLIAEQVEFGEEDLLLYTEKTYPDLRKCLGMLQQNTTNGVLQPPREEDESTKDYLIDVVGLFKKGKYIEARKMIISQADPEEYEQIYRFFYQNLELFGKTQDAQDKALVIIKNGLVNDGRVADRELNLSACLAELTLSAK